MRFYNFCAKIGGYILASWLWLIGCIPILTVGASTTAFCTVLNKLMDNREGYIINNFWGAFKANFKKSTKMWIIFLVAIIVAVQNLRIMIDMTKNNGGLFWFLIPVYVTILVVLIIVMLYAFAYNATFEDNIKTIIKNSFLMAFRHLGTTITILEIDVIVLYIGYAYSPLLLFFSGTILGYINMRLFNRVFSFYKPEDPSGRSVRSFQELKKLLKDGKKK